MENIEYNKNNMSLKKEDILDYAFYDETNKTIGILNERKLKEYLNVDEVLLHEE